MQIKDSPKMMVQVRRVRRIDLWRREDEAPGFELDEVAIQKAMQKARDVA